MILFRRILRSFALAAGFASLGASGAFTQLTANKGEVSDLLTVNTAEVYAATQGGGLYKSTNAGVNWARIAALPARVRYVNKVAGRDGQTTGGATIYAATTVGVFKTTNSGTSWTSVYGANTAAVAVDPANSNNVLIGVKGLGILRSTDGGTSWTAPGTYDSSDITSIVFQTSSIVWAGFDSNAVTSWGGVFRSGDGGATWAVPPGGQPANKFVKTVAVDNVGNVYAGAFNGATGAVYRSTSGTGAWTPTTFGVPDFQFTGTQILHHDKGTAGRMWAGSGPYGYSLWRLDAGAWQYANIDQDKFSRVNAIATFTGTANRVLVAVNGMGVYLSTNGNAASGGVTLATSNTGLAADRVNVLAIPSTGATTIYMGLTGASVQRSTNSGGTWSNLFAGFQDINSNGGTAGGSPVLGGYEQIFTAQVLGASPTTANNIYAGILGRGLYRFNGASWDRVNEAGLDNSPISPVPANIRLRGLYVQADNAVYYSIFEKPDGDGNTANNNAGFYRFNGATWTRVLASPWPESVGAGKIIRGGTNWYALVAEDFPYRSLDGTSFAQYTAGGIPHIGFARLYFTDLTANVATPTTLVANTNKGFFRSTNDGVTWASLATSGGFSTSSYAAMEYSGGTLFVGTLDGQLFCSTNNGDSFTTKTLPAGWANSAITDIVRNGTTLYYLTDGNGAWQETSPTCP